MTIQENQLLDLELEVLISAIEPFEIDTEGTETIEKFGKYETKQIKLNHKPEYSIEAVIHVQPVYVRAADGSKDLLRNDITVMDAVIFKGDDMLKATPEQNKRLETAIENKLTVFPRP